MPPSDAAWQQKLAALRAFVAAHGHLPTMGHPSGLGKWAGKQREAKWAAGGRAAPHFHKMTPERVAALEAVPGWRWDGRRAAAAPATLPAKRAKK